MSMSMRKFKKILILLFLVTAVNNSICMAENISQKEASKIAETFFNSVYGQIMAPPKFAWNGRFLTTDRLFSPFYVYNHPKGGFVIIAADSKAYPILGYSKSGKFEREKLTDAERDLLKKYAHEIELIRYDSRIPERAIAAWQNMPLFINKVINNPYDSPEFEALSDSQRDILEEIDRRNNAVMLPSAIEFQLYDPDNFRDYTLDDVLVDAEEIPFKFYEDFIAEIENEQNARYAALEERISPSKPTVVYSGGAHYTIRYPENIKLVRIYNMQGAKMMEKYFTNSEIINLDISSLPAGFYALMSLGEDGKVYGMKLFR